MKKLMSLLLVLAMLLALTACGAKTEAPAADPTEPQGQSQTTEEV